MCTQQSITISLKTTIDDRNIFERRMSIEHIVCHLGCDTWMGLFLVLRWDIILGLPAKNWEFVFEIRRNGQGRIGFGPQCLPHGVLDVTNSRAGNDSDNGFAFGFGSSRNVRADLDDGSRSGPDQKASVRKSARDNKDFRMVRDEQTSRHHTPEECASDKSDIR